ncbi:Pentatricopeptide repeat-containing protein [Hibiscus syriacus]|uniref:Pentatricopeptide repeat-containing protein n=2 Tax=Hibiscus syriacus TaxID=106335 RepID=A0A6A2ZQQ1_HIBSY|nr:pentatricopeptide repeat-containing protein At1g18900-like isoform X1 [Hibiscus syriacus]KAE8693906.1 Pentatricopeptide repeat-containing protein [Hibiscus syriacus]
MQIMLRAKHIGNLSNGARSFLFSGSRGTAADGNSCTCSEDETCVSRRQNIRNEALSKPSAMGALKLGTASQAVDSHGAERATQPVSHPIPLRRSNIVNSASSTNAVQHDERATATISDQFVKAGIEVVSFLSDLMNYKLPLSDGGTILSSPRHYVVESTRTLPNIKTPAFKPVKRENFAKVNPKQSSEVAAGEKSTVSYHGTKDRGNKSNFVKGYKRVSNAEFVDSSETHSSSANTYDRRKPIPQRVRAQSHRFMSNFNSNGIPSSAKVSDSGMDGFRKSFRDMKMATGVSMTRSLGGTGHAVETVSQILQQLKWGPAAEQALENLNFSMDAFQANQVLKQIPDPSVALGFFYWLKNKAGFKHDGHTYTTMVGILGRARQFGAINRLLDQMVKDDCQPNVVTYNRLIHSYGRANYLNEAINVFNQMQEIGCEPDRVTYCTLIDIHAKAGFLDVAMDLYQRMQAVGLSPDTFTYSVIINCLGKAGHLPAANRLFCEMGDQGCVPNLVTYNIMIALHAKARNYDSALKLYRDMQNAGFEPDKVTYSIVMEVLGHCGYLDEAEAIFGVMKRKNWVPDETVYGLLVDIWGKAGNIEKAWQWYQSMLQAGLLPNVPTYNSLLSAFLRVHRLSDAYNLLQSMLDLGLNPSLQTYTLLLSYCTEARSPYDMGTCCQLLSVTGHPAHMFLLSMPSAGPDGRNVRDHVDKFLDMMHSEDRESKRGLVDAVVDFLHKSGLKEEAGSVWEVAMEKNVYPDAVREKSSCYWLINLHVMSDGTAVTALARTLSWFRQQMLVTGVSPSRIDIVTGWGRRSRVTGSSLVRQAVQDLLNIFSFPFFTENGNSGCFVGSGEPLNRWLLQSYVERMHLL